jgi:SAM-dependent methyltransferase
VIGGCLFFAQTCPPAGPRPRPDKVPNVVLRALIRWFCAARIPVIGHAGLRRAALPFSGADPPLAWRILGYSQAMNRDDAPAEAAVLARLLSRRRFGQAVYVGSGYGRFSRVLRGCADRVTVTGPGALDVADASADLAVLMSVLQRRPQPADELSEVARILRPGALAVIEAANVLHGPGRRRYQRSRQAVTGSPGPAGPRAAGGVAHHPELLMLQLAVCGLQVERLLPVASLRHPALDGLLPQGVVLAAEYALQVALATAYLGRRVLFLARKRDLA